ncbi:MAG: hypothetical protein ABUL68_01640 [Pseudomonadota bacterium]
MSSTPIHFYRKPLVASLASWNFAAVNGGMRHITERKQERT